MLIIIHLTSLSPLVSEPVLLLQPFAFPHPPCHIPPPPDSGREIKVGRVQERPAAQGSLYLGYGLLEQLCSLDRVGCFLFSEIRQRAGEVRIIRNKPSIISRQPQELSHLLFGLGTWTGRNRSRLINLGTHLSMPHVEAQILYLHPPNCTLPWVRRESSHPQRSQDSAQMFHMPLPIITVDNDVIEIIGVRAMWPEDFVHEMLKGGGSPEQAER